MQKKNLTAMLIGIFILGLLAGFGLGNLYGSSTYNALLEQKATDLENRYETVNDNYLLLVREYNKLFTLRGAVAVDTSPVSDSVPVPTKPAPIAAPTTAAATPTKQVEPEATAVVEATPIQTPAIADKLVPEFEGLAIDGTGPLEGPPPLEVRFTDLSTGNVTSWEWDFGDGETSTEQNPSHVFRLCPGEKQLCTVKLKVCGPDGCETMTKPDYLWVSESCTGC